MFRRQLHLLQGSHDFCSSNFGLNKTLLIILCRIAKLELGYSCSSSSSTPTDDRSPDAGDDAGRAVAGRLPSLVERRAAQSVPRVALAPIAQQVLDGAIGRLNQHQQRCCRCHHDADDEPVSDGDQWRQPRWSVVAGTNTVTLQPHRFDAAPRTVRG